METQTGRPKSETMSVLRWDSRLMYLACLTSKPRRNRLPIIIYIENILQIGWRQKYIVLYWLYIDYIFLPVELGNDDDGGAEDLLLDGLEIVQTVDEESGAAEDDVGGQEGAGEIIEDCPQARPPLCCVPV